MVYLDKDFVSTLAVNQKNGNGMENREIILAEIADLIATDKASVIEALNASGVLTPTSANQRRVVDAVVKNAPENRKLRLGLAYLIAQKKSEDSSGFDMSWLFGKGTEGAKAASAANTVGNSTAQGAAQGASSAGVVGGIIGAVSGAIGGVFNYKASKEQAKAQDDANRAKILDFIQKRQGGGNTGLYIGLGLLAVAAIVVIVLKRKSK